MNCYLHPDTPATAFCRTCGRAVCSVCQRPAEGTIFCQEHVPVAGYAEPNPGAANPYFQGGPVPTAGAVRTSPPLAFVLGFIPGVGAIYNGQYLKGLVHALAFGLLITIMTNSSGPTVPLIAILVGAFVFYMPFEAYHTAKKREMGLSPDEWSSILPQGSSSRRVPAGPIILIVIGVLYLLNSLDLMDFRQIARFWPVLLIVAGSYMLYSRMTAQEALPRMPDVPRAPASPYRDGEGAASDLVGKRHE